MERFLSEQALSRVNAYLSAMGIVVTREVTVQVLRLIERGFSSEQQDPLHIIMRRVNEEFALQHPDLPPATPPMTRGSVGYRTS
jgi:chromosomal replication initiation ATPase DnaA